MESRNKALSHLRKSLRSGRGEELPMQKVSVIAPDKKGLEEGLKKAEELLPKISEMSSEIADEADSSEHEKCEDEECKICSDEKESEEPKSEEKSEELEKMSHDELVKMVQSLKSRLNY